MHITKRVYRQIIKCVELVTVLINLSQSANVNTPFVPDDLTTRKRTGTCCEIEIIIKTTRFPFKIYKGKAKIYRPK